MGGEWRIEGTGCVVQCLMDVIDCQRGVLEIEWTGCVTVVKGCVIEWLSCAPDLERCVLGLMGDMIEAGRTVWKVDDRTLWT